MTKYTKPMPEGVITPDVTARYWANVKENPEHGITLDDGSFSPCLDWQRYIDRDGYGRITVKGWGIKMAHQVGYYLTHGQACPPGLVLDHKCDRECCANGLHVRPATQHANIYRGQNIIAARLRRKYAAMGKAPPID